MKIHFVGFVLFAEILAIPYQFLAVSYAYTDARLASYSKRFHTGKETSRPGGPSTRRTCFAGNALGKTQGVNLQIIGSTTERYEKRSAKDGETKSWRGGETLNSLVDNAALLCGIPEDRLYMIHRLIQKESGGDPWALSSSGARGLMQIKPGTSPSKELVLWDPWQNVLAGSCHLRHMYDLRGDWREALQDYRLGHYRKAKAEAYADWIMRRE